MHQVLCIKTEERKLNSHVLMQGFPHIENTRMVYPLQRLVQVLHLVIALSPNPKALCLNLYHSDLM